MTPELYIHCFIASVIGIILHVAVKIRSMAQDHKLANLEFSLMKYLKDDRWALVLDLFASVVLIYLIDEWFDFDSRILTKIKSIFVFVGFTGSYIVLQLLSVAKSRFRQAIDQKTTIADNITGTTDQPTPTPPAQK